MPSSAAEFDENLAGDLLLVVGAADGDAQDGQRSDFEDAIPSSPNDEIQRLTPVAFQGRTARLGDAFVVSVNGKIA